MGSGTWGFVVLDSGHSLHSRSHLSDCVLDLVFLYERKMMTADEFLKGLKILRHPLHRHPRLEEVLGIPDDHVIIDKQTYLELVEIYGEEYRDGTQSDRK